MPDLTTQALAALLDAKMLMARLDASPELVMPRHDLCERIDKLVLALADEGAQKEPPAQPSTRQAVEAAIKASKDKTRTWAPSPSAETNNAPMPTHHSTGPSQEGTEGSGAPSQWERGMREAMDLVLDEWVAEACEEDAAYNRALSHAADAIVARIAQVKEGGG